MTRAEAQITDGSERRVALTSALILALALVPSIVAPIAFSVGRSFAHAPSDVGEVLSALAMSPMGVTRSIWVALLIGALATLLAWPAARLLARSRRAIAWAPLLLTPMLMPSYLAYAGWGMIRDPGTLVGDALARAASSGARWAPIVVGKTLAIGAMALWIAPLAALVLAGAMRRRDASIEEALRLEPASRVRRAWALLGLHRAGIVASIALVSLVMLGSGVPLHLAQLETLAIVAWRELAGSGRDEWWRVWLASAPLILIAVGAGWWIGGALIARIDRPSSGEIGEQREHRVSKGASASAVLVWVLAVGGPLAMFAWSIRGTGALSRFWRTSGDAALSGVTTGAIVAGVCLVLGLALSAALGAGGRPGRLVAGVGVRVMLIGALLPGVLVGAALAETTTALGAWSDPIAPTLACVARTSFIVGVVACWGAWSEPPELRDTRRQLACGWRAWAIAALPAQAPALVGGALAAGLLALYEIEASVMVWPAGRASLSQQILEYLHYSRMDELSAAAVWIGGGGLLLALIAGALIALSARRLRRVQEGGAS